MDFSHRFFRWSVKPGEEDVGLPHGLLELGVVLILGFKQGYSREEADQKSDEGGGEYGHPAPLDRTRHDPDSPPQHGFSEIVWMSRVLPETPRDELFLSRGLVGEMSLELLIAYPLDDESAGPDDHTEIVGPVKVLVDRVHHDEEGGRVANDREECLEHKDVHKGSPVVPALSINAPAVSHINVPVVFSGVSETDVASESDGPDGDHADHDNESGINYGAVETFCNDVFGEDLVE